MKTTTLSFEDVQRLTGKMPLDGLHEQFLFAMKDFVLKDHTSVPPLYTVIAWQMPLIKGTKPVKKISTGVLEPLSATFPKESAFISLATTLVFRYHLFPVFLTLTAEANVTQLTEDGKPISGSTRMDSIVVSSATVDCRSISTVYKALREGEVLSVGEEIASVSEDSTLSHSPLFEIFFKAARSAYQATSSV